MTVQELAWKIIAVREWFSIELDPESIYRIGGEGFVGQGQRMTTGEHVVVISAGSLPVVYTPQQFDNLLRYGYNVLHSINKGASNV